MSKKYGTLPVAYDGPMNIYLQWGSDEVTWCEDKINETDIEFVTKSQLDWALRDNGLLLEKIAALQKIFFEMREILWDTMNNFDQEIAMNTSEDIGG